MAQTQLEKSCVAIKNLEEIITTKQALIKSLKQQIEFEEEELLQVKNRCTIMRNQSKKIAPRGNIETIQAAVDGFLARKKLRSLDMEECTDDESWRSRPKIQCWPCGRFHPKRLYCAECASAVKNNKQVAFGYKAEGDEEEVEHSVASKITPIPVAITHTPKNSKNYKDVVANQDKIKYYFDDQGVDAKHIKIGAHFYSRPNNKKGFIYQGLVSEISSTHQDNEEGRKFCYLKVDKTVKSSIGELNPGDKVPEISPGGRGSTKFMRDAAHFSGITPLKKAYFHGILH